MYAYTTKVNRKTFYYTGKGMSAKPEEAKKVYSPRMALEMHHEARLACVKELGTACIELSKVDDTVHQKKLQGIFLTEEND